jgi:transcriptional regulator with XRE-family HTH domain
VGSDVTREAGVGGACDRFGMDHGTDDRTGHRPDDGPDDGPDDPTDDGSGGFRCDDPALVGRFVVRVRRRADLSQRDLAARLAVSPSTIARIESGDGLPSLSLLSRLLAVGGLRLAVVDADGAEVLPVSADAVRDNRGRRFPAHLDVAPPDEVPSERALFPRYDRPAARGWFRHRAERDRLAEGAPWRVRPTDHPTNDELARRRRLMRGRQPRVDAPPVAYVDCPCLDACFEALCVPACPCQCEPELDRLGSLARGRVAMIGNPAPEVSPDPPAQEPTRVRTS